MKLTRKSKNKRFARRHVLEVKMRTSQRRKMRLAKTAWIFLLVSLMSVAFFMAREGSSALWEWAVAENQYFTMRQLQIQTEGVLNHDQIRRWAGLRQGLNLFNVDLGRVRRDLELIPVIASAEVERILPDALKIRVRERDPIARLHFPRRQPAESYRPSHYTIDEEGIFMPPLAHHQFAKPSSVNWDKLPLLVGFPVQNLRPGYRSEDTQIRLALELIAAYQRSPMAGLDFLKEIDLSQSGLLRVTTAQDCQITFGPTELDRQLRRWKAIFEYGHRHGKRLASLDLSITNHIPLVWQTPPSTGPTDS